MNILDKKIREFVFFLFEIIIYIMINKFINKNYNIYIENELIHIKYYLKIYDISSNKIKIKLSNCILNIIGENLLITKLDDYELSINGKIKEIKFNE